MPVLRHYRRYEAALAKASCANNTRRARAIHAKIANAGAITCTSNPLGSLDRTG